MSPDPNAPVALQLGVLIAYSLGLIAFGLLMSRRVEGTRRFFVAHARLEIGRIHQIGE